jgi:hypothetical protein
MDYTELINQEVNEWERRKLALVAKDDFGNDSINLQIQIEQNGNDAFIDLSLTEAQHLLATLNDFVESVGGLSTTNHV